MAKLYLSILLSLLCTIGIQAQKLNVESFVAKTNDITARTQPRQDINGNDCALVKVRMATDKASFSGNVFGDVAYDKSEYFVYMPHGSKRLTIKLEGYLPLDINFEKFGINSLEGKTVYVMTIAGVSGTQQLEAPKTKTGWIILESEPSGASVYINDEFVGNTPLSNYMQAYGTYQYKLESPNYHSATGIIELNAGKFEQKVILKPAFGSISVKSNIAGATILIDGKNTGKQTPATLTEIPSGPHSITLQMNKYAPRQQEVIVEDGQTVNVSMALDARFAMITINSLDEAEIYSNGKLLGKGRISDDMMEGYYDIEARLEHHKSVTKQILVVAGQSQDITLNPIPKYGSLDIVSTPHDANISVDGKAYGKTPTTIESLLEGIHQICISLEGYADYRSSVDVKENETASISAKLMNSTNINITSTNPNAILYIDDIEQGTASGVKMVSYGQHQIRLVAKDWKDFTTTINVSESQTSFSFEMEKLPSPYKIITVGNVSFKMIRVEGGKFKMGEMFKHKVTLDTYYIGETEVTQELWQAVMGKNPAYFKESQNPVEQVSFDDCLIFVQKLNSLTGMDFRIPTEAEWEFAARGGNKSQGYKYSGSNTVNDVAWYNNNSNHETHNVAQKLPNELGLYDMSGNVCEWCQDTYGSYSSYSQDPVRRNVYGGGNYSRRSQTSGSRNVSSGDIYSRRSQTSGSRNVSSGDIYSRRSQTNPIVRFPGSRNVYGGDNYSRRIQTNPTGPSSDSNNGYRGGGSISEAERCRVAFQSTASPSSRGNNLGLRLAL